MIFLPVKRLSSLFPCSAVALALLISSCAPVDAPPKAAATNQIVSGPALLKVFDRSLQLSESKFIESPVGTGVMIQDVKIGTGPAVQEADQVSVRYTGWLPSGQIFDSNLPRPDAPVRAPFKFVLGFHAVILGWEQGVKGMKVGGVRKIIIPSNLAYGVMGRPPQIPGNTPLLFEVEVIGVRNHFSPDSLPASLPAPIDSPRPRQ